MRKPKGRPEVKEEYEAWAGLHEASGARTGSLPHSEHQEGLGWFQLPTLCLFSSLLRSIFAGRLRPGSDWAAARGLGTAIVVLATHPCRLHLSTETDADRTLLSPLQIAKLHVEWVMVGCTVTSGMIRALTDMLTLSASVLEMGPYEPVGGTVNLGDVLAMSKPCPRQ